MKWILVFVGGGAGSALRLAISLAAGSVWRAFPWGTLVANLMATTLLGLLFSMRQGREPDSSWWLVAVGFCGGLSTFSAFSLETAQLMRDGHLGYAVANVLLSSATCLLLAWWLSVPARV
ncbi:MAG: fluoride efflux transporter FluC [Flavobacteriales bacterium]|jgi:CrcB protein